MDGGDSEIQQLTQLLFQLDEDLNDENRFPYSKGPAELSQFLYLGDMGDAASFGQMKELGITHLLNCTCVPKTCDPVFFHMQRAGYKYLELDAQDYADYDMTQHFEDAFTFIQDAKKTQGKVLVYCKMGMNRSATVCIAYIMKYENQPLLNTVKKVRISRKKRILTNTGFQRQLIKFSIDLGSY